jgi:hypothetical protein
MRLKQATDKKSDCSGYIAMYCFFKKLLEVEAFGN